MSANNIVIKNIYYMLSYAFSELGRREYADIAVEEFENAQNLFAALLTKGIGRQLKQGLYREYIDTRDDLATVRGKINISETLKLRMTRKSRVMCEFDELSENNLMNQILKSTAVLFLDHPDVETKFRSQIKKQLLFFANVDWLDLSTVHWSALRFQRHNQSYQTLMGICRLVTEGLLMSAEKGSLKLASFVDDQHMSRLFERFVREYYKRHHPELQARASHISWALDDDNRLLLPQMQTDMKLQRNNTVLIIDTKYYSSTTQSRYGSQSVHSANLYQIFTYVKNEAGKYRDEPYEVSGMLLYARTQADTQPDQTYYMSGNKISVKTLDLNRKFSDLAVQLDTLAEEHFTSQRH